MSRDENTAVASRDRIASEVQAASAALSRFGDALVTESVPYEAEPADEERSLVVTLSTADRDRHGDVLEPAGAELDNYRRNPVVLFGHRHDLPAVGKVLWVRALPGRLVAKLAFARTRLGEELYSLYSRGYMKAWSVGFIPHEWERLPGKDSGVRVSKWELLEVSAVPVPANPEALSKAIEEGEVTEPLLVKSMGKEPAAAPAAGNGPDPLATITKLLTRHSERLDAVDRRLAEMEAAPDDETGPAPEPEVVIETIARAAAAAFERRIRALQGRIA